MGGVPSELLRAGVYEPGTHRGLVDVVDAARTGTGRGEASLRSRLAAEPAALDEAVRRLAELARREGAEAILVAEGGDLLLAAPVAREAGLPLRRVPGVGGADAPGWPPRDGERAMGVATLHRSGGPQDAALEAARRAGAAPLGWLALTGPPGDAGAGRWSAVPPEEESIDRAGRPRGPGGRPAESE